MSRVVVIETPQHSIADDELEASQYQTNWMNRIISYDSVVVVGGTLPHRQGSIAHSYRASILIRSQGTTNTPDREGVNLDEAEHVTEKGIQVPCVRRKIGFRHHRPVGG